MRAWIGSTACLHLRSPICAARRVLLARDRLGKKPLFHATFNGVLHFASEIKAIKASPLWNGERDLDSIEGYLSLGYFVAPATAYRHVRKLEPAHTLSVERLAHQHPQVLGRQRLRHRSARRARVDRRSGCAAGRCRVAPARKRSADRRVPLRRHRFGPGGVVHGRSARHARRSRRRWASIDAGHNELEPAGVTARHFSTRHNTATVEPNLDEVLDPIVAVVR